MNFRYLFSLSSNLWIWQSRISQSPKNNENYERKEKLTKYVGSTSYLLQSTVSQVQQHISPSAKSNSTYLFLAYPCPFLSYPFLRQLASYVYALKYCTNTVANVDILYMNFIRCDVLVMKLNGVGSSKLSLSGRGAWTPSRQLASYVYALKYCTNTVANVNILYMNFIRCDVLVACPHRKLNGVGSSKPNLSDREHHRDNLQATYMLLNIAQILSRTLIYYTWTLFGVMCSLHARIGS
jgi:hypothetical protein